MRISFLLFVLATALTVGAQHTPQQKYEVPPADFDHVYLDHVAANKAGLMSTENGQFIGQTDEDGLIYGYGAFLSNDGGQRIGQYRNGDLLFGITLTAENATVGSRDFYASYSLSTGQLEYIFQAQEKKLTDTGSLHEYAFVSINYRNGDRYVGEIYRGKRHGYGIYYYSNGDYWYGQYRDDVRCGFGALFTTANRLFIGQWNIEDTPRLISVRSR